MSYLGGDTNTKCMGKYRRKLCHVFISFYKQNVLSVVVIYTTTFFLVLPLLCHNLGFSSYFVKPKEPYKILEAQNEERINALLLDCV